MIELDASERLRLIHDFYRLDDTETFNFDNQVKMEARILFKGEENYKPIGGTYIETNYWYDSLKRVDLDV